MEITYKSGKDFTPEQMKALFLSVGWSSGQYPEKLVAAMKNYGSVFSAWEGHRLVGLISTMDDGVMTAYVHYLLVDPACQGQGIGRRLVEMVKEHYRDYLRIVLVAYDHGVEFYKNCGFEPGESKVPMYITSLQS